MPKMVRVSAVGSNIKAYGVVEGTCGVGVVGLLCWLFVYSHHAFTRHAELGKRSSDPKIFLRRLGGEI